MIILVYIYTSFHYMMRKQTISRHFSPPLRLISMSNLFRRDFPDRFPIRKILAINILFRVVSKRRGGVLHAMRSLKIPRLCGPAPGTPAFGETAIENKLLETPGTPVFYSTTAADPHSSRASASLEFTHVTTHIPRISVPRVLLY